MENLAEAVNYLVKLLQLGPVTMTGNGVAVLGIGQARASLQLGPVTMTGNGTPWSPFDTVDYPLQLGPVTMTGNGGARGRPQCCLSCFNWARSR